VGIFAPQRNVVSPYLDIFFFIFTERDLEFTASFLPIVLKIIADNAAGLNVMLTDIKSAVRHCLDKSLFVWLSDVNV
jgi:hypothetical protein